MSTDSRKGRFGAKVAGRLDDNRRQQLARIHVAKKQLQLDDDVYRAVLSRITGKGSSADMDGRERNLVLAEFARLGFKAEDATRRANALKGRPDNVAEVPMLRKVAALLAQGKRPWSYAHNMAKRMHKVQRVEWLNEHQLHALVSALQIDANRHGAA
jgi:phage gp16-like protein